MGGGAAGRASCCRATSNTASVSAPALAARRLAERLSWLTGALLLCWISVTAGGARAGAHPRARAAAGLGGGSPPRLRELDSGLRPALGLRPPVPRAARGRAPHPGTPARSRHAPEAAPAQAPPLQAPARACRLPAAVQHRSGADATCHRQRRQASHRAASASAAAVAKSSGCGTGPDGGHHRDGLAPSSAQASSAVGGCAAPGARLR